MVNDQETAWNVIDRGKPKYSERNLCQCHFVHQKSHTEMCDIETGPPRWGAWTKMLNETTAKNNIYRIR